MVLHQTSYDKLAIIVCKIIDTCIDFFFRKLILFESIHRIIRRCYWIGPLEIRILYFNIIVLEVGFEVVHFFCTIHIVLFNVCWKVNVFQNNVISKTSRLSNDVGKLVASD